LNKIGLLVKDILKRYRISQPPYKYLQKIAKGYGILVKLNPNLEDDISGFLYLKDKKPTIFVNQNNPPLRRHFTIAHELGHFLLGHNGDLFVDKGQIIYRDSRSKEGTLLQEREANRFAAELLMPEEMLIDEIVKNDYDLDDSLEVQGLSEKFGVSTQAMMIRLTNLGWSLF
jgi:Zn-dependent peptidase ImmA (M78 family)